MTVVNKILDRCTTVGDCMIWQGGKHRQGYGMTRVNGQMTTTHRAIGLEFHGDPGDSGVYKFSHTCNNLLCCNPRHIIIKKHKDVMQSTWTTDRTPRKSKYRTGLTREEIINIRNDPDTEWGCNKRIAEKYGCSDQTVSKIRRGITYKWIK